MLLSKATYSEYIQAIHLFIYLIMLYSASACRFMQQIVGSKPAWKQANRNLEQHECE